MDGFSCVNQLIVNRTLQRGAEITVLRPPLKRLMPVLRTEARRVAYRRTPRARMMRAVLSEQDSHFVVHRPYLFPLFALISCRGLSRRRRATIDRNPAQRNTRPRPLEPSGCANRTERYSRIRLLTGV